MYRKEDVIAWIKNRLEATSTLTQRAPKVELINTKLF